MGAWLLLFAAFAIATRLRGLPWHDRWAKTEAAYDPPLRAR
jgi:hypothetical protein